MNGGKSLIDRVIAHAAGLAGCAIALFWLYLAYEYKGLIYGSALVAEDFDRADTIVFWTLTAFYCLISVYKHAPRRQEGRGFHDPTFVCLLLVAYAVTPLILASHEYLAAFAAPIVLVALAATTYGLFALKVLLHRAPPRLVSIGWVALEVVIGALPLVLIAALAGPRPDGRGLMEAMLSQEFSYYLFGLAATYSMVLMTMGALGHMLDIRPDSDVRQVFKMMGISGLALGLIAQAGEIPASRLRGQSREAAAYGLQALEKGDLAAASAYLERALERWAESPTANAARARLALRTGDMPGYERWHARAARLVQTGDYPPLPWRDQVEARVQLDSLPQPTRR